MSEDIRPVWFHVDLDAFYASVEQRDNSALKGRPVIVGAAPGHRGVVSACSYEARRFGVHSAMPISEAYRRCPQGVYLPVRMEHYHRVSREVMGILAAYSPQLQQISVDEAFLDMSGTERLFGPVQETGRRLKTEVREKTGLAITVGIGPNKYLAKLATNAGKPDGLVEVLPGQETSFLDGIVLKDLWGIGEKTLRRMAELNISTVAELRAVPRERIARLLGDGAASFLTAVVNGADPGIFAEEPRSRSLSSETTFEHDRTDRGGIDVVLLDLCQQVMFRMIEEKWKSKTVSLKLRFHDFTTVSAQKTLKHWVSSAEELHAIARELLASRWSGRAAVRLIGIGFSSLSPAESPDQLELFSDGRSRQKKVEETVARIQKKLGDGTFTKASLLDGRGRLPPTNPSGRPRPSEGPSSRRS